MGLRSWSCRGDVTDQFRMLLLATTLLSASFVPVRILFRHQNVFVRSPAPKQRVCSYSACATEISGAPRSNRHGALG